MFVKPFDCKSLQYIFLYLFSSFIFSLSSIQAQTNIVTYAGNLGKETFYDITQITDGSFLVTGYTDSLTWIPAGVSTTQLTYTGTIPNTQGTNRYGFILHLSADLQSVLRVVHFPRGAVEDIRFIKTTTPSHTATGDLFISCNTAAPYANNGGYLLAKLNNNFVDGPPTALVWHYAVAAQSGIKDYHPWDVTNDGKTFFIMGEHYGPNWSAVYCLNDAGQRTVVENWRTHWLQNGSEWRGTPASSHPQGISNVNHSGIVLKTWGRCELRSWNSEDYNLIYADGNGGTKKGKWPLDVLFNGPCDPASPTTTTPGYTGYSTGSNPVYGGTSIVIDKRNNDLYIGLNFQSKLPDNNPDFEPAVISMTSDGTLKWWSRLYHEITPSEMYVNSSPDQYVDALAIDYANDRLAVGARCHGNNVENFWEGNTVASDPSTFGFQNGFTGTSGNIHITWLGKLALEDGVLTNSTYMAEYAEGTGSLGSPHPDLNLDGWPNPNSGWPNVNTTRLARNNIKVSSSGDLCVMASGRRTITTANAYQKMVKPAYGGKSCWNNFVRVYEADLKVPKYSSLVVGVWDTITQAGGDNIELFGVYKTGLGVICVGRQKAVNGVPSGNNLPTTNVLPWGKNIPQNESGVLVYYQANNLINPEDDISSSIWTGTVNTTWENPSNWSNNAIPSSESKVIIPSLAPHFPVLNSNATVKKIELKSGSSLILQSSSFLKVED